jgi:hypothetical protein
MPGLRDHKRKGVIFARSMWILRWNWQFLMERIEKICQSRTKKSRKTIEDMIRKTPEHDRSDLHPE